MHLTRVCFFSALAALALAAPCRAIELIDGERIVFLGGTLVERDADHGYLETRLTAAYPDRNLLFRNLGWSGDTVFAEARAGFDTAQEGFARLKQQLQELKPTLIVVAYGGNESFDGRAGLDKFRTGLATLTDMLAETQARLVLATPLLQERPHPRLPDPAAHNANIPLYRDAIRDLAAARGAVVIDLFETLRAANERPLTDNGVHLTDHGYWRYAVTMEEGFRAARSAWRVELAADGAAPTPTGTQLSELELTADHVRFVALDATLPAPPGPADSDRPLAGEVWPGMGRTLQIRGLADGRYELSIDGRIVASGTAADWQVGVALTAGPEFDQVRQLRAVISIKNQYYFHRWRPQNDTYLFGFRKYEQGQNAIEIPKFDPLIAEQEAIIASLRRPVPRRYELTRVVRPPVEAQSSNY